MTFCEDFCGLELGNSRILSSLSLRQGLGSAVTSFLARFLLSSDFHGFLFGLLLRIVPFRLFLASRLVPGEDRSRENYPKIHRRKGNFSFYWSISD